MEHTKNETAVLGHLVNAWNAFVKLPSQHPDEQCEFRTAMNALQGIIGMRLRRRVAPEVWPTFHADGLERALQRPNLLCDSLSPEVAKEVAAKMRACPPPSKLSPANVLINEATQRPVGG